MSHSFTPLPPPVLVRDCTSSAAHHVPQANGKRSLGARFYLFDHRRGGHPKCNEPPEESFLVADHAPRQDGGNEAKERDDHYALQRHEIDAAALDAAYLGSIREIIDEDGLARRSHPVARIADSFDWRIVGAFPTHRFEFVGINIRDGAF